MTLTQLEYIIAVDMYHSFGLAAEKCFVTQPTLSMQIKKLETSLGIKIFDRSKHPILSTEIGQLIIKQARVILTETKKMHEIISNTRDDVEGELRIGVIPTIAPYLLPNVLGSFMSKYPNLHLQIWEFTTDKIIQQLKTGILDCGILATPTHDGKIAEHFLFHEKFVAYIAENSPLKAKKYVTAQDVLSEKLWLLNEGHCMRNQVLNICQRKRELNPERAFEYNTGSVETLKRMVDTNGGVTILPHLSIMEYSEEELNHVRFFKSPEPVREISLVTSPTFLKQKALTLLSKEIITSIPKQVHNRRKKKVIQIE